MKPQNRGGWVARVMVRLTAHKGPWSGNNIAPVRCTTVYIVLQSQNLKRRKYTLCKTKETGRTKCLDPTLVFREETRRGPLLICCSVNCHTVVPGDVAAGHGKRVLQILPADRGGNLQRPASIGREVWLGCGCVAQVAFTYLHENKEVGFGKGPLIGVTNP